MEIPVEIEIGLDEATPGEPAWLGALREALAAGPEPENAARLAAAVLESLGAEERDRLAAAQPEALVRLLFACCSVAPFLAGPLRRSPDAVGALLASDLDRPRQRDELERAVADAVGDPAAGAAEPGRAERALRASKYFELARLTARDACEAWVPLDASGETLTTLSDLADTLLDAAFRIAEARVTARYGPPRWRDAEGREHALGFCILGLGKLGSEELNYSSDVDLVYVFESPPAGLVEGEGPAPLAYFTRVAQQFGPIVSANLGGEFLYRVDLELRPEGSEGPLVVSDENLAHYYDVSADGWEKAAFMKARPVAGDRDLGWRTIRAIRPMIHRSASDYGAVRRIRELKERIATAHGRPDEGFNVKLDSGGIRDIEFLAQAMQLLHGGRIPQLVGRSTQDTIDRLGDVGIVPRDRCDEMLRAYRFLRRVENRLQMEAERQVHRVPRDDEARRRLALAFGFRGDAALESFDVELARWRALVLETFEGFLADGAAERLVAMFVRHAPQLMRYETTRRMMEDLAGAFAREVEGAADPQAALINLDRFISAVGARSYYYELLLDRPELVPRLVATFGASRFLSDLLARHPRLIEPVFANPETLLLDAEALAADLRNLRAEIAGDAAEDAESRLAALRLFHHRQTANIGLLDIAGKVNRDEVEAALSDVAEVCVADALDQAREACARARDALPEAGRNARFAVVGLGKLGSREMGYGSDLDVIFLYDLDDVEPATAAAVQEFSVRLAQRLISALQTPTGDGRCYEIDARMRPSGNQGTLVTSLAAYRRYHEEEAAAWERQALLRARPVAGDAELAAHYRALRDELLKAPLPDDFVAEVHRIRRRMEEELARETRARHDFKTGRGGLLDVETVVQVLRLRHGETYPELLEPEPMAFQLAHLERHGLLDERSLAVLRDGWEFLRRLGAGLRIAENRSISDLDEERGDLDGLARRLGYEDTQREAGARRALLRDYRRHTGAVRAVYAELMGEEASG